MLSTNDAVVIIAASSSSLLLGLAGLRNRRRGGGRRRGSAASPSLDELMRQGLESLAGAVTCEPGEQLRLSPPLVPARLAGVWRCCPIGCGLNGCSYSCEGSAGKITVKVLRGYERIIRKGGSPVIGEDLQRRILSVAGAMVFGRHPNILRPVSISKDSPILVYEHADGGTLEWQLGNGWGPTVRDAVLIGIQVAAAIKHLHSRGVAHGNITAGNTYIVNGIAKLGEPALRGRRDKSADIAQLGKLILRAATRKEVRNREGALATLKGISHSCLREVVKKMIEAKAGEEPTINEVINDLLNTWKELNT